MLKKKISKQLKRRNAPHTKDQNQSDMKTVRIPFVEGLSQEVCRVARTAGVRCVFFAPNTLQSLYCAKDPLPKQCATHAVYSVKCKTCNAEYVGETKRALSARKKEHWDAIQ